MKTHLKKPVERGFALIVTLSLMILLTVIAVGLLGLSSISLRASSQGEAMATARNNARLGMMLALGELQKSAGSDQRITAPANLVNPAASPGITGVWESWKPGTSGTVDYNTRKTTPRLTTDEVADGEFVTWLASGNPASPAAPGSPPRELSDSPRNVALVSERKNGSEIFAGTFITPTKIGLKGGFAWTVLDEGTKARIDLAAETNPTDAMQRQARLRAPARPQAEAISTATANLRLDANTAPKVVSLNQGDLHLTTPSALRPYLHDLTTYSVSLPTNVADGGIKADLTRAFEDKMPTDLTNRYIYYNTSTPLSVADPKFTTLASFYQLYKKALNPLLISTPPSYRPADGQNLPILAPLNGTLVSPVITRVSVVFSLFSRSAHGKWAQTVPQQSGDPKRTQMVYLIYTPVITVYNPYSVPIRFRDLKVTFRNLPVAFKFFRNGQAQSVNPNLLSTFHSLSENTNSFEDPFSCTASSIAGSAEGSLITLYPGEARVFGENQPAGSKWSDINNFLWQGSLDSSKTKNVYSGAGWDYRSGYMVDWLRPKYGQRTADNGSLGAFGVCPTDTVNVEVTPIMPGSGSGKFTVDFQAKVNDVDSPLGIYEYKYGTQAKLNEILANGNATSVGKVNFPFRSERDWTVAEMTLKDPDNDPLSNWGSVPKQFAIFTLGARTANDSLYPGKPGRTSSFVHHVLQMDATKSHPALLPMEMSLLPITGSGANTVGSIDSDDADRMFYFSGTNRGTGAIQYVSQSLPSAPIVNLADLRHANLASSGHLPLVQSTVGESLASPVVAGDQVRGPSTFGYEVLDHSWLANQTLWDGYFFSGIRDKNDADLLFEKSALPLNPRAMPLLASGVSAKDAALKAIDQTTAWSDLAATVAIKGGFNVNSTSLGAWKAVLSSLRGLEVPVLGPVEIKDPVVNPASQKEVNRVAIDAAFPRYSRPLGDRVNASNSSDNQRRWSGFRELTDDEVTKLANSIVAEVRSRGPFLSMAEFVNRRLAPSPDEMATAGVLEAALRKSKVNNIPMGPSNRVISEAEATSFGYANPKAAAGNTEEGASAVLSQGDLLSAIGASITVRSDTFVIRAYGDARNGATVTAKAWCEAVIQRTPSFVDPTDAPEKVQAAMTASGRTMTDLLPVNRLFGRRFQIISFRWLSSNEV